MEWGGGWWSGEEGDGVGRMMMEGEEDGVGR